MEMGHKVLREINKAYDEREDDRQTNPGLAFDPPNASKIVSELTTAFLQELGEGESVIEDKGGVVTKYSKVNGKLFKENILEEV